MSFYAPGIRQELKHAVAVLAKASLLTVGNGWVPTLDGQYFKVPPGIYPSAHANIALGRYESDELGVLRRNFKGDDTIVEIGSNLGYVSRYAFLERLNPHGNYVCVEPNPFVQNELVSNMEYARTRSARLGVDRSYTIVQAAVCDKESAGESIAFRTRADLGSRIASKDAIEANDEKIVQVPMMPFSQLMNMHAPHGASLICDAEGAEVLMVGDFEGFKMVKQIVIELHEPEHTGFPVTPDEMVSRFRDLGFISIDREHNTHYLRRDPS
jgi:FkbM family methyltransferase